MRRIAKWALGQFDCFMFWCTETWSRVVTALTIYVVLLVISLALFPLWRLIYFGATVAFIIGLHIIATVGNFTSKNKPPE